MGSAFLEPGTPFTSEELAALARIGERSPCTRRWLEYFVPAPRRYYLALGTLVEKERAFGLDRGIVLRLKDAARLAEWRTRRWEIFATPPQLLEATLQVLNLVEQLVAWPCRWQHRLFVRGADAGGAVVLSAHLAANDPCRWRMHDGEYLHNIEEQLLKDGIASPEPRNGILVRDIADVPWKLRAATPKDDVLRPLWDPTDVMDLRRYVPPGCAIDC